MPSFAAPGIRRPSLLLLLAIGVVGCAAYQPVERDESAHTRTPGTSPTPGFHAGSCRLNPAVRINERSLAHSWVGGRLAANVNVGYVVTSVDKSIWALRTNDPPPELRLIRERLDASAPAVEFVGRPIQDGDGSALPEWGPTYYVELRFPATGCWRMRLRDGQPDDFIVFQVIEVQRP